MGKSTISMGKFSTAMSMLNQAGDGTMALLQHVQLHPGRKGGQGGPDATAHGGPTPTCAGDKKGPRKPENVEKMGGKLDISGRCWDW